MFEDMTIEEESMYFPISETNFRIIGLLNGSRIGPFAICQEVLQMRTSQKNRIHLPIAWIQIFSGKTE